MYSDAVDEFLQSGGTITELDGFKEAKPLPERKTIERAYGHLIPVEKSYVIDGVRYWSMKTLYDAAESTKGTFLHLSNTGVLPRPSLVAVGGRRWFDQNTALKCIRILSEIQ